MFKRNLFLLTLTICAYFAHGQCDYNKVRYAVSVSKDVVYGVLPGWSGRMDTLKVDIYKPVGDGNTKRPVLMMIHGGGFSGGNKKDLQLLAERYASQGIVCVSVGYRLGFIRPLSFDYPYTLDQAEVTRAAYRGQQDAKGAIRFMKDRNLADSTNIDQFYAVGFSAGAFIALSAGFATDSIFKPTACKAIADGINFNGTFKRPDLGPINGTLHQNNHDAGIKGVFNFFGAIFDTSMITENGPKLFQYHQSGDPVVPCGFNRPYHGIGLGIPDNYPYVMGSCVIEKRLNSLASKAPENVTYIHAGSSHDVHDPTAYNNLMSEKLNDWICASTSGIRSSMNQPLSVYPNPVSDVLHIDENLFRNQNTLNLKIYNLSNQLVMNVKTDQYSINISSLPGGLYYLKFDSDGREYVIRFLKQ